MNLARVIGKVWATRKLPSLEDAVLLVLQPMDGDGKAVGSPLAAVDTMGALQGQDVYYVSSKEASMPMSHPASAAVDACIVGIVDRVDR